MGGRGCPRCGSHDTEGLAKGGISWCHTCDNRWFPCRPGCRGYVLRVDSGDDPVILGCPDCGVPDKIARWWPEAWRAMQYRLAEFKLESVAD
jgi:hypothetical protein